MHNKAFFLDRDGVINNDSGYVHKISEFKFLPGVFDACRSMKAAGYQIIVITNQAGIGRGYYTEDDFWQLTRWMNTQFAEQGIEIDEVMFCPHHPEKGIEEYKVHCQCRKPAPGMLLEAAKKHQIDLKQSYLVGDKFVDAQAGINAGIKESFLITGNYDSVEDTEMFRHESLLAVVQYLSLMVR